MEEEKNIEYVQIYEKSTKVQILFKIAIIVIVFILALLWDEIIIGVSNIASRNKKDIDETENKNKDIDKNTVKITTGIASILTILVILAVSALPLDYLPNSLV